MHGGIVARCRSGRNVCSLSDHRAGCPAGPAAYPLALLRHPRTKNIVRYVSFRVKSASDHVEPADIPSKEMLMNANTSNPLALPQTLLVERRCV